MAIEKRYRPTRARERDLEAAIHELLGAFDQQSFRLIGRGRLSERTLAAMAAARAIVPERPEPVRDSPMQGEERG
jgi:hypothetical protein